MSEVIALALSESNETTWEDVMSYFKNKEYNCTDTDNGIFVHKEGDTFKGILYEETKYMLFESILAEDEQLLPNVVFDFVLELKDDNALISIGEDEGYGVEVHTEMNLNKFQKEFLKAQESEDNE